MRSALLGLCATILLSACAPWQRTTGNGEADLRNALVLLEQGDYPAATAALLAISNQHPNDDVGRRALLVLTSATLDPRNTTRAAQIGAQLAARYLRETDNPGWTEPLAETLYLVALDLGAADSLREQAESEAREARAEAANARAALPRLPGPGVTSRLRSAEAERDKLAARVKQLESELAQRERQLSESNAELSRIRKTLRP